MQFIFSSWNECEWIRNQPDSDANALLFALVSPPRGPLFLQKLEISNLPHSFMTNLNTNA